MNDLSKATAAQADLFDMAATSYDLFRAFMVGGFEECQSLRLVAAFLVEQARNS